jgi:PEP-CTERM motif-containing protein
MRHLVILAASALALTVSTAANAQDATASTTGQFTQVYLGPGDTEPVFQGVGTEQITFGVGFPSWTITYTPSGDVPYTTEPFFLGSITAFNGSVFETTAISGLNLHLTTTIEPPVNPSGDGIGILDELIAIIHTSNSSDPIASADALWFESLSMGANILENQSATFLLFGTVNSPLTLTNIEIAPGSENTGFLTARGDIPTDLTPAVPEPGTWAMMLLGFAAAGVGLRRRRAPAPVQA